MLGAKYYFATINMGIRRSAFLRIGGCDESFDGGYGWEDIDFGFTVDEAGLKVQPNRKASATHIGVRNDCDISRNTAIFAEKWGDKAKEVLKYFEKPV